MKDPAFLFYDGDAARDVSHMNRLERGAYFDLIQAQRKFGGYTVEQARKILGKDFEECWGSLELILSKDENGAYYIEWVKNSMEKRQQHAEKQRERIQNYWDNKKKENNSNEIPNLFHGITTVIPLVNENEIENEIENGIKGGKGGKIINIPFEEFWNTYDKKVGDKNKLQEKWEKLSDQERTSIIEYIPKYKLSQPEKTYRKNPDTFFNNKSWNDEIISKTQPDAKNKPAIRQGNYIKPSYDYSTE